ncbi:hypothetical protein FF021_15150 [Leptospira noguchii]|nr:hypothetical protein FF021_15150 [Leptospira noguchii]
MNFYKTEFFRKKLDVGTHTSKKTFSHFLNSFTNFKNPFEGVPTFLKVIKSVSNLKTIIFESWVLLQKQSYYII